MGEDVKTEYRNTHIPVVMQALWVSDQWASYDGGYGTEVELEHRLVLDLGPRYKHDTVYYLNECAVLASFRDRELRDRFETGMIVELRACLWCHVAPVRG